MYSITQISTSTLPDDFKVDEAIKTKLVWALIHAHQLNRVFVAHNDSWKRLITIRDSVMTLLDGELNELVYIPVTEHMGDLIAYIEEDNQLKEGDKVIIYNNGVFEAEITCFKQITNRAIGVTLNSELYFITRSDILFWQPQE